MFNFEAVLCVCDVLHWMSSYVGTPKEDYGSFLFPISYGFLKHMWIRNLDNKGILAKPVFEILGILL